MNVQQKIKQIVGTIEGLSFEFNDWTRANVTLDSKQLPVCLSLLPISGQIVNKNGNFRDWPNALIAFLDKAEYDFEGEENEPTVERMKNFAKQFIIQTNSSGLFEPLPENITYQAVYDKLDVNLTGVVLQIQLKELKGTCTR